MLVLFKILQLGFSITLLILKKLYSNLYGVKKLESANWAHKVHTIGL